MDVDGLITLLIGLIAFFIFVLLILVVIWFVIERKKTSPKQETVISSKDDTENKVETPSSGDVGRYREILNQESIMNFLEFDEIKDNMIIRKDKSQYVMVLQCNGVNYDLLSESEKVGVEQGFVSFLNTLRFPVQLYVQSRTLNLKDIIQDYKNRVEVLAGEIESLNIKIKKALTAGNRALKDKLEFEKRRKNNVLEYGLNIIDYVERMSSNKNILQQKTYIVVSYYALELGGNTDNYSKDEIDGMCFSELYTRAQNISSALGSCSVTCKLLDSEELAELLYVAYNRDESELYQFSKALDAEYDSLYSTGKDVIEKREKMLDEQLNIEAIDLATNSILEADRRKKEEDFREELKQKEKIREKAINLVDEYKNQLDPKVYDYSVEEIGKYGKEEKRANDETPQKRRTIVRRNSTKGGVDNV